VGTCLARSRRTEVHRSTEASSCSGARGACPGPSGAVGSSPPGSRDECGASRVGSRDTRAGNGMSKPGVSGAGGDLSREIPVD
jgi:hypothetical protein